MPKQRIDDEYLREFFGIAGDEEGRREMADIRARLERVQFDHNEDICTIDREPDAFISTASPCSFLVTFADIIL